MQNTKKVYLFLAEGFEEVEAITPIDYLRRAGIDVVTVGIGADVIEGGHGIKLVADTDIDRLYESGEYEFADMIVLPGGGVGVQNLENNKRLIKILKYYYDNNKNIGAICAAPSILGKLDMLKDRKATVYPTFAEYLYGANVKDSGVCVDGNIITAKSCNYSAEFSYAIIENMIDRFAVDLLKGQVYDTK